MNVAAAALTHLSGLLDWCDYVPDAEGGNAFVEHMPDDLDAVIMAAAFPGPAVGSRWPWGQPSLQVLVRAAPYDHPGGLTRAQQVLDALDVDDHLWWAPGSPDAVYVEGCTAVGAVPAPIGRDDRARPAWSLNFTLHTQHPTSHRAA